MFNNLDKYRIVLASNSPRRRELLSQLGLSFTCRTLDSIEESYPAGLSHEDVATYIAKHKAEAYRAAMSPDELIITADTIVCIDNQILGKPNDRNQAIHMLSLLSGRTHQVITGVAILTASEFSSFAVTTQVKFAKLSSDVITYYVDNYAPFDKAGAYGIQEWIGFVGVEGIEGSFFNVMGLPVQRLCVELEKLFN